MTAVAQRPGMPPPIATVPRDVLLILSYTSWSGMVRRGHIHSEDRLALHLMGSSRARRLVVANPYRSRVSRLGRNALRSPDEPFPASGDRHLHEPLRLRRRDPAGLGAIERSVGAYVRSLRRAAGRFELARPVVITTHPLVAGFGRFDWAGPVSYYATDDLAAYPPLRRWWPAYEAAYQRLRATGRRVAAITPGALARVGSPGPALVIPNGIEPQEWLRPTPAPDWFSALPSPRMLYVGTLDDRIDVEQVRAAALAHPGGSVVLVGRCPDPGRFRSLGTTLNVSLRPAVTREELLGLVAAADVGLIPHVANPLTTTMSPLKLYEYLAAGLPVAAAALPGTAGVHPERCALARGGADFGDAVARALALGRWDEDERRAFVRANAWERRLDGLLDLALAP